MQNQDLGSQVLSSFVYKAERRAKFIISLGENVTPSTNKNPYIIKSNADLKLRAGQEIHFKPGFSIEAGAIMHAKIYYKSCNILGLKEISDNSDEIGQLFFKNNETNLEILNQDKIILSNEDIRIFPNPTSSYFSIENSTGNNGLGVNIYSQNGNLLFTHQGLIGRSFRVYKTLPTGVYFVEVQFEIGNIIRKLIVL